METTIWQPLSGLVVLLALQLCNGLPLDLEHTYADAHTQFLTGLVALLLTICSVVCLAGCLCCERGNGFKDKKQQEFRDSPVGVSVASNLDHGHVNPIANTEFTIFRPLSPPLQNNNVFLANQQIITRVDEDYRSGDIDVTDWFSSGEKEFPRTQLKYIRELGKGWFGRVVEGTAIGLPSTSPLPLGPDPHHNGTSNNHTIDHPLATTQSSITNGTSTSSSSAPRWAPVVVRILDAGAGANQRLHFLHDASIYRLGRHPNVLRLEGRCLDTVPLLLLHEYCAKGDLKQYLLSHKSSGDKFLTTELPLRWCWQLASALKHFHSYNLAHPDLAARNCQLDDNLQLKLGDYGTTVAKYPDDYYHGSEVVPVRWRAPETIAFTATTIQQKKVNMEGNIWSLGIAMWEIFEYGALPYSWLNNDEVVSQVLGPSNVRLPKPKCKILYTDYIYRLMQLCWSTVESRPAITQIELMLLDLLQVYQHTQESNSERSSNAPVSLLDFDNRWDNFKPNTIVKTDNQELNFKNAVNTSPSLKNLAGSLNNLLETEGRQLDSWLENVASSTGDLSYVKGLSDAINDLDNAIAMENFSSSESSTRPNSGNVKHARNKLQFKLGPIQSQSNYLTSADNKIARTSTSESETEDEHWKKKIERGAYTEKVRQKSRSVADLMVLTHIDTSESDSETMPSFDPRVAHKNSFLFGSEGNLLNVETRFQEELRKLQVERRDSLLFVPERKSSSIEDEPKNLPVYNVYNVVTISPVKVPNINLEEIINYEKDLQLERRIQKADSPDIVTSKYLKENNVDVPDIISSCNGTVDVGSSNASTETLDKLEDLAAESSGCSNSLFDNIRIVSRIVPKLTEIIENNAELMDYIIEKYDSDGGLNNKTTTNSVNKSDNDVMINFGEVRNDSSFLVESANKLEFIEAINPKYISEQFVDTLISDAIDVYTSKQQALIQATQDFINTEIIQYEDSIKVLSFNQEESSVILGACDDYSIDLYASLKTTVDVANSTVIPAPLQQTYSSASATAKSEESPSSKINFNLETWDKFLGSSFELNNEDYEDTGMFSQPQSLLFIENNCSKVESDGGPSFLEQLTDLDDVALGNCDVLSSTYVVDDKNDSQFDDGLDVSDINIVMDDCIQPELNETFTFNEEESIWKPSNDGGWYLHPQVDGIPTGKILKPFIEGDHKEYSVGFDMDDDILTAVRNELLAKLPHAQRASSEQMDDSDDSEASTSSEKNEIIMSYNYYNKQLSPIPEESYSELLISGQSTPNCTINSSSSSSDSEDSGTNGNNTWSDSPDHSAVKLSAHNISDSEDDSPQLPVDTIHLAQLQQQPLMLFVAQQQRDNSSLVLMGRNDDSISEGCMTRSELVAVVKSADSCEMKVDLLEHVVPKHLVKGDERHDNHLQSSNTTIPSPTNTTSFLDHERKHHTDHLPRFTLNLSTSTQLEESSTSSDSTYVTASDGSLSSGSLLLNFGVKGGAIVPPLNSPEDRLPWRPVEAVVVGLRSSGPLQMEKLVLSNGEDENDDDVIEVSSAFLDETSGSAGIPSSEEKQLSQDSDTMPIDELQTFQQLQEQLEKEREENCVVEEEGEIQGGGEKEYANVPNRVEETKYCIKSLDKSKQKNIENEYDDVAFHDHLYINEEKVENNTSTPKSLEYDYATLMNHLNTNHTNNDDSSTVQNLYDDVPSEDTIEHYTNQIDEVEDHNHSSYESPLHNKSTQEEEDYVDVRAQCEQEVLRDYVNVQPAAKDSLRDYVNERNRLDLKEEEDLEVMSPPSEVDLDADVLEDGGEEDVYTPLEDIRFEGPAADLHLMSTSFSDSNDLGDEHDEDWDSGSDTGSSSSGLFIWKEGEHEACVKALHAAPDTHTEQVSPLDEIREESEDTSSGSDVDDDADGIEFVPSAWDKYAQPAKSALRSPEKTLELKPKGVWFKKQKYHCIYEYPREPESPLPQQTFELWQPAPEYPMCPAEWDLDRVDGASSSTSDVNRPNDQQVPEYNIDEDFYIRSAAKPFELASLYGAPGSGQSQFFPGGRSSSVDGPVDYWLRPISTNGHGNGVPGSSGYGSEVSTTPTPDSCAEDSGASSGELLSDGLEQGPLPLKTLCQLAATAIGLLSNHDGPNTERMRKLATETEIGGLRHTRNKLKLDLPPSPSAFTSNKSFNVGNVNEEDEPIVKRNSSAITFSTFGKSRFLVQQVATPPIDDATRTSGNGAGNGKNVSFEALPYKPRLSIIESHYGNYNQCSSNSSQNSSREDLYTSKEHNPESNVVASNVSFTVSSGKVEVVRGEASLLDSADEDSGIESSTLDRKCKPASLSTSPSAFSTVVTGTIMEI